jgi:hypothetical protein
MEGDQCADVGIYTDCMWIVYFRDWYEDGL